MATISGRVVFDRDRSATVSGGDSGLANIPVVLQNISTTARLTVLTDAAGNYTFLNVPNGSYRIVESYGASGGVPTPGDFSSAAAGSIPQGVNPPITVAGNPPPGSTNLDSVTPDTLLVTVTGADLTNQNFYNGPVIYTPIQAILDPCAVISGENLIRAADNGTFGSFPQGTPANTGVPVEPYPDVTPDFTYVLPNPDVYTPAGGEYTVQNIMNNALSEVIGAWWRIADHTTGNETGRMMIVNGFNPGAIFFQAEVPVQPNTNYLFSAWILNLFKVVGYPNPELGVVILDQNGAVLYSATLGILIPVNTNAPEWKQIGSVINSRNNTSLTVEFLSEGPEVIGNDYAIDDVSFQEIQEPVFLPVKTVDRSTANVGDTVRYTVTLTNTCESPLTSVFFQDTVPGGLAFVPGSVTINGAPVPVADPNAGFVLPNVPGGGTVTVGFSATVTEIPNPNPTLNRANIRYEYTPVEGGIPGEFNVVSNDVPVQVGASADISVVKTASPSPVTPGSLLTYTLTISNAGPSTADNVLLTDAVPAALANVEYSINNGASYQPWPGSLPLGSLAPNNMRTVLLRGQVSPAAEGTIVNTAVVSSTTPDPDPTNNTDTNTTDVITTGAAADIAVTKSAQPATVSPGQLLTYTVGITNQGPDAADGVTLYDEVQLSGAEFSTDGGVTWRPWSNPYLIGRLAAGESRTVLIRGTVPQEARGTIANTAVATSATPDPDLSNNTATVDTPVTLNGADLSIQKTAFPNPVCRGRYVTFTLTVSNAGPAAADQVVITDLLPKELSMAVYSVDNCQTWRPWTGSYTVGTLAAGASVSILVAGFVSVCVGECFCNTAEVSSATADPNPSNNTDSVAVWVRGSTCCRPRKSDCGGR